MQASDFADKLEIILRWLVVTLGICTWFQTRQWSSSGRFPVIVGKLCQWVMNYHHLYLC